MLNFMNTLYTKYILIFIFYNQTQTRHIFTAMTKNTIRHLNVFSTYLLNILFL